MRIAEQLKAIAANANAWARAHGGHARVANDKSQLLNILTADPGAPRVAILFISEEPRGQMDAAEMSRCDRKFWAIISRGMGFRKNPGDSLTEGTGGGRPMFELVEELRDRVRSLELDPQTTERPVYYGGIQPFDAGEDLRVDAYAIEITVGTDIGELTNDPNQ